MNVIEENYVRIILALEWHEKIWKNYERENYLRILLALECHVK